MEAAPGRESPSLTSALNLDALEEVFVHCDTTDLLALRATCTAAAGLLDASERVWLAKLRDSFGLNLKATAAGEEGLFARLARHVYEASRTQQLRFQGVFVNGGVDEDAMHYFVDNMFRPDKAPYCSNCSRDADCIALLLDGEVPRDAEFARVRQYMIRRCRYAAALILNMPEHGRDPDDIMHILEDWTDAQLEGFFKDLVSAMEAEHALGRLLVFDIPHERLEAEERKIRGVHRWLLDRPKAMRADMLKLGGHPNVMFDTSILPKLTAPGSRRLAGVVHEVSLSRVGNLTCPVQAGALLVGCLDHSRVQGWPAADVLALLRSAAADPLCAALGGMVEGGDVAAASAAGKLPPILATDQTLAGVWHEFDTSLGLADKRAAAPATKPGGSPQKGMAPASPQQQAAGGGEAGAEAAGGSGAGAEAAGGGGAGGAAPHAGIVSWRPLLWFRFHSAEEAVAFVHRHRPLVEQHGSQATLRHHGPPPTRRHHVVAPPEEQLQLARHAAGLQAGQQQQQQGLVVGVPAAGQPGAEAAPAPGAAGQVAAGLPHAGVPAGAPPGPPSTDSEGSEGGGDAFDPDAESGSSESDVDEGVAAQGAWLDHWAQDELGADLQQEQDVVVAGQGLPFEEMDEGSSGSEGEEEGGGEEHLGLGGGGGAGQAAPAVQASAAETLLRALTRRSTRARNRLRVPLTRPAGANLLLVKLISQENLMDQYGDPHTWPNIDMTFCGLAGRRVELPPGVALAP